MKKHTETWREIADRWKHGQIVWSLELGGMGPSYEQAIQVLLFGVLSSWEKDSVPEMTIDHQIPASFLNHADEVAKRLRQWGFSGAQYGVATSLAYHFIKNGYSETMNSAPEDQHILVQDNLTPYQESCETGTG